MPPDATVSPFAVAPDIVMTGLTSFLTTYTLLVAVTGGLPPPIVATAEISLKPSESVPLVEAGLPLTVTSSVAPAIVLATAIERLVPVYSITS